VLAAIKHVTDENFVFQQDSTQHHPTAAVQNSRLL